MKQIIILLSVVCGFIFFSINQSHAQVVVKVRPVAPKVIKVKKKPARPGMVWVNGHWQWSKRQGKYVWKDSHYVRQPHGKIWVNGHWKQVKGGHVWVPGHWKRA